MKINKQKAKRGMTLIEVIISVALLSILLIPLSDVVISSFKNSKRSEYAQKASYIGQKMLEELKAYDEILIKTEGGTEYFELLDGDRMENDPAADPDGNTFTGSFNRTIYGSTSDPLSAGEEIYKIEVTMEKSDNFQYSDNDNLSEYSDADFRLNFENDGNNKVKLNLGSPGDEILINNNKEIVMELNGDLNLKVYEKNKEDSNIQTSKSGLINNKLLLYVDRTYNINNTIEINNSTSNTMEVYLIKNADSPGRLNVQSNSGDVILYEENEIEENKIGDMYNYTITVSDEEGKELFKGSSSKNLFIKK